MTPIKLYTLDDVVEVVPISRRTLVEVVAKLGFRAPKGRRRLVFTEDQVIEIQKSLTCRQTPKTHGPPPVQQRPGESLRAARTRQTKEITRRIREDLKRGG